MNARAQQFRAEADAYIPGPNATLPELGADDVTDTVAALEAINRAVAALKDDRLEDAFAATSQALSFEPRHAMAWRLRGDALRELKRLDEALDSYARSIMLDDRDPVTHWHRAITLLLSGDYGRGWAGYESRWRVWPKAYRGDVTRQWAGEDVRGKIVLLWAEQGFGDTLQFCRYAQLVAKRGARVVLQVQKPLLTLLVTSLPGITVVPMDQPVEADFHCPLLSLPAVFGTRLGSVPAPAPIKPAAWQIDAWHLPQSLRKPKVGIAWFGNRGPEKERNRSIAAESLAPLLTRDRAWFSLQKTVRASDAPLLDELYHFGDQLTDFARTASLIANLDLVITADTAVAHLAASMGKPTWILVPYIGTCWRWMTERADTPWYPTARLFRQERPGEWGPVIERVAAELRERFAHG